MKIAQIYIIILNSSKVKLRSSNENIFMVGGHQTRGTVLKDGSLES